MPSNWLTQEPVRVSRVCWQKIYWMADSSWPQRYEQNIENSLIYDFANPISNHWYEQNIENSLIYDFANPKYDGKRARLQAVDGNFIDTMYVDKRLKSEVKNRGNTLVICCDGNSAFYEIGYMFVAIEAGYSTLGWNPPGFACSTGLPCPEQMRNAVDVVMKYALNVLQFEESDIMLFAYSIGTTYCIAVQVYDVFQLPSSQF